MKLHYGLGLTMLAGIGIGAAAVSTLSAQNKSPAEYYIVEVEPTDCDAFIKELSRVFRLRSRGTEVASLPQEEGLSHSPGNHR
jgi:hypothetical protein